MDKADNRYIINDNERKSILEDIDSGIWRIELEGTQCRLYGDKKMYSILGADPKMAPEQLYQHWYKRIAPEYISYVDKAVEKLLAIGQPIEVEYIWNHPENGRTVVRCDATLASHQQDGKFVMLGLHRDITQKLKNDIMQADGYHIVDYYIVSHCGKSLIKAYEDMFIIDRKTKAVRMIAYKYKCCSRLEDGSSVLSIIDRCVFSEDKKKVYQFFSDEAISDVIENKKVVSIDYRRGARCGRYKWVRGTLCTIRVNDVDELLFIAQDIEHEYKIQILQEEKEDVLDSIIQKQSIIYEYDIYERQLKVIKSDFSNAGKPNACEKVELQTLIDGLCKKYVGESAYSRMEELLSYENILKCVQTGSQRVVSLPLNPVGFHFDYIKISVLPSCRSKIKAYLVLELMDREKRLYPILESYIRDMADHCYCLDLKTGYFIRLIGDSEAYAMPPAEGQNYKEQMIKHVEKFVPPEEREMTIQKMSPEFILKALEDTPEFSFIESIMGQHGEIYKKLIVYKPLDLLKGYVLLQRTDITEKYRKEKQLEKAELKSLMDPLTQLYNRLGSEKLIKQALTENKKNKNAALILVDLDNFKDVNDRFGHPAGDQVLCEIARKLKDCLRPGDIIGRLGGDEYIAFVTNLSCESDVHQVLSRVVNNLKIDYQTQTEHLSVTVSVGAVFCNGETYAELYQKADIALYQSKRGKNKYSVFAKRK